MSRSYRRKQIKLRKYSQKKYIKYLEYIEKDYRAMEREVIRYINGYRTLPNVWHMLPNTFTVYGIGKTKVHIQG